MSNHAILWEDIMVGDLSLAHINSLGLDCGLDTKSEEWRITYLLETGTVAASVS